MRAAFFIVAIKFMDTLYDTRGLVIGYFNPFNINKIKVVSGLACRVYLI